MSWLQFSIEVSSNRVELVSEAFTAVGALSITVLDAGDEPLLEPLPGETPLWSNSRVVALFGADVNVEDVKHAVEEALPDGCMNLKMDSLEDCDWSSTWRDSFHAMQFGAHLWVCPTGESVPDADAVVVQLDPGLAFGTGTHATTALCLEWLDANKPDGKQVIDYGCGSGILAIAACKLGADQVTAVDIDPQALQATRTNAAANEVARKCNVQLAGDLIAAQVDLVLANILANPLIELADTLGKLIRPGGCMVLTGILEEQANAVMAAYDQRFTFREPVCREEWVLLEGEELEK